MFSYIEKSVAAIANGYPYSIENEGKYIVVENPDFQPDDGSDPALVLVLDLETM